MQATPRLKKTYTDKVHADLMQRFALGNPMRAPRLQKITVNMGLGEAGKDKKFVAAAVEELGKIVCQKPVVVKAKRSAATFKLRQGDNVGVKVTLRGDRMWYFLDKLISVAIPRIRDFNGIKHGFDRAGNYSFGLADQTIFPEIKVEKVVRQQGMDVCMSITGGSQDMSREMLLGLGFPLKREIEVVKKVRKKRVKKDRLQEPKPEAE